MPEAFIQEIKEWLGQQGANHDDSSFIGKELVQPEEEDFTATNHLKNMQDMANAPWAASGLTREEYANGLLELEAAEAQHNNDEEPLKVSNTRLEISMNQTQLIFPDFDYIVQENKQDVQSNYTINLFNEVAMKSSRFKKT